jgi:LCP family protein required for cell wall assembly
MTRTQKTIIAILGLIIIALAGAIGYTVFQNYRSFATQPLGPALPFTPLSLPPTWTPAPAAVVAQSGNVTLAPTISFTTNTPLPICGGGGIMNILVIGSDSRPDSYLYGLSDVMRLVRVDFFQPKVTVLEFPRDMWVEIPHISEHLNGQDHEKLNQAFLYGQPGFGYWDNPSGGAGLLSLTLNKNFGVRTEHYFAVNMRTFVNVVNAVDGIDINVPDKETSKLFDLPRGENHLNGDQALKVARNRQEGTFGRAQNQNIILCALRKKLTDPQVITKIPELIKSFQDNIRTDFTPQQLSQLACLGTRLPPQNILFTTFPQELFKRTRIFDPVFNKTVFIWDVDFNILSDYVTRFQAGTWPVAGVPSASSSDAPEIVCQ